jgi:hypothetical protein
VPLPSCAAAERAGVGERSEELRGSWGQKENKIEISSASACAKMEEQQEEEEQEFECTVCGEPLLNRVCKIDYSDKEGFVIVIF